MLLNVNLVTGPTVEPVTLAQLKANMNVDSTFTDDDALISALGIAARDYAERYTHRSFFTQTWCRTLDHFPVYSYWGTVNPAVRRDWAYYSGIWQGMTIALPNSPVASITSIIYSDLTGTPQTLPSSEYTFDGSSLPGRIVPAPGLYWPLNTLYVPGSVKITYVAGIYEQPTDCPQTITQAILLLASHWYLNRESTAPSAPQEVPFGVKALLDLHRVTVFDYESVV